MSPQAVQDWNMDNVFDQLSKKIDDLIEKTTQEVVLPEKALSSLEEASEAIAACAQRVDVGQDITAMVMKAVRSKRKVMAAARGFDDKTLSQLVGMAVESMVSDDRVAVDALKSLVRGDFDPPSEVERAARDYEDAAQKLLIDIAGEDGAREAIDADAAYYMFMTQEGHGVGIHDGNLDGIPGLDLDVLDKALDTNDAIEAAHRNLQTAIYDSAFDLVSEAIHDVVDNANFAFEAAVEAAEEVEQERDPSDYFPDGPGDYFVHQWNNVKNFVRKSSTDHYLEDVAAVCQKALDMGISGEEIEKAMYDVGEYEFVPSHWATKNAVVSSGQIGDVDLTIDATRVEVKNAYGNDLTLQEVAKLLDTKIGRDVDVQLAFDKEEALAGDIAVTGYINGYVAFIVDPDKLAAELGVK